MNLRLPLSWRFAASAALAWSGWACSSTLPIVEAPLISQVQEVVTESHLVPAVLDKVGYNDIYTIAGETENGTSLSVVFSIFTFPMIPKVSGIAVIVTDPSGRMSRAVTYRLAGAWSVTSSPFRIQWNDLGWFGGDLHEQRLVIDDGKLKMDITFKNLEPAWRPHGGKTVIDHATDDFVDTTVIAPKSEFSGKMLIKGRVVPAHGFAVLQRDLFTKPAYAFAHTWRRLRFFGSQATLLTSSFDTTMRLAGKELGWLYLRQGDSVVSYSQVDTRFFAYQNVESHSDQPYIKGVDLAARAGNILVNYRFAKAKYQMDLLTLFHQVLRSIVQLLAHPNIYSDAFEVQIAREDRVLESGMGVCEQIVFNRSDVGRP